MKNRLFTALERGVVMFVGDFSDEALLRKDYPAPQYTLVLDRHLPFPEKVLGYQEQRRMAYPPLADFADALYWQSRGDNSKMDDYLAAVDAVKTAIPKT